MKSSVLKTCLIAALLSSAALTGAAEVYTWKGASGNSYSDTPNRLQPKRSGVVNIRTHNVKPAVAPAAAASEPVAEQHHFVQLEEISSESLQIKDTLKEWVDNVPDEELELYFDLFFGTILESGISSINELSSKNGIDHVRQLVSQAQTLEPEQVEILKNLTQLLLDARFQAWKNHF